ncbi:MAG: hypothetical protein GY928_11820 [Colwellia sp.]|nr:hypothetical protein [Colwellia sp.]
MTKIVWRENKVISIETQKNVFVLAQMLVSPYLLIFNEFRENDAWEDNLKVETLDVLMTKAVTRQFLKDSNISTHKEIVATLKPKVAKRQIRLNGDAFKVKIFEGTDCEKEIYSIGAGGGSLVEFNPLSKGNYDEKILINKIDMNDETVINQYETATVEIYPNFNKRLYFCYLEGRNVDPDKELIFKRPLLGIYKSYFT